MLRAVCSQTDLYEAVQTVARGVSGRSTQPVQNNICLETRGEKLHLVATDLEVISLEAVIESREAESGAVTVPARLFAEVTGALPAADVVLRGDETNALHAECGKAKYSIRGLAAADFERLPPLVDDTSFTMPQALLRTVISQTRFAASREETRPILTGALFALSANSMQIVATDRHRLALRKVAVDLPLSEPRQAIVSSRALGEVERILREEGEEPATISVSESQVQFVVDNITVGSRLIEGQFPNYQNVLPEAHEKCITLEVDPFADAVRRAHIVAREDGFRIFLRAAPGQVTITAQSADVGQVEEEVPAELEGEEVEIAFNARYLLDVLAVIASPTVRRELCGPLNPCVVRAEAEGDYLYVLMALRAK